MLRKQVFKKRFQFLLEQEPAQPETKKVITSLCESGFFLEIVQVRKL